MGSVEIKSGMLLVHSNQSERLRDLMIDLIRAQPLAPLETETVLCQSNGIAQWLKIALARRDDGSDRAGLGIAAGLEVLLPSRFIWQVYRSVLGGEAVPEESPMDKPVLLWRLMQLLSQWADQPAFAPLAAYLQEDLDQRKRFQLAQQLADLFDQYQVYRADWLTAWEQGEDVLLDQHGARQALGPEDQWQAHVWRALQAENDSSTGRAAIHARFMAHMAKAADSERPPNLPRRILVFGLSSLPLQSLEVLSALSRWCQVVVGIHNPCRAYWIDSLPEADLIRQEGGRALSAADGENLYRQTQPLLASWGRQGRDYIRLLMDKESAADRAQAESLMAGFGHKLELWDEPEKASLLGQIQADILELRPPDEAKMHWPPLDAHKDRSIVFHSAHSALREVEVLHDQLLAAFNENSDLSPRDVIVMVPDITAYAPAIRAVFGLYDNKDSRYIPFSIADQSPSQSQPMIAALEWLLSLPQARFSLSEVAAILELPAVCRRFGLAPEEAPRLLHWAQAAHVHWGLHALQRESLGVPIAGDVADIHTWVFGLRRLLLGYAVGDAPEDWQGIQAFPDIGGLEASVLGPLAELLEALDGLWQSLRQPRCVDAWAETLQAMLLDFFAPLGQDEELAVLQLQSAIERWQQQAQDAEFTESLNLDIVREHLLMALEPQGLSQRFMGGAVSFATLMPMRAIPFRRMYLLGMNDADYPRSRVPLDFDLMAREYRPGDRSRREDDRYLFLEALLSAREHLHISWVGRSITDNTPKPPSVLVRQLQDHIKSARRFAAETHFEDLCVEHPLQAFSPAYVQNHPYLLTYAAQWYPENMPTPKADVPLPEWQREGPLDLAELREFAKAPVKTFFLRRLKARLDPQELAVEDDEPFAIRSLRRWQLQQELFTAQQKRIDGDAEVALVDKDILARFVRSGALSPGGFSALQTEELSTQSSAVLSVYQELLQHCGPLSPDRIVISIDDTPGLHDELGGIHIDALGQRSRIVLHTSRLLNDKQKQLQSSVVPDWMTHLALQAVGETMPSYLLGAEAVLVSLPVLERNVALSHLKAWLTAYQQGMTQPLPLDVPTALGYLYQPQIKDVTKQYEGSAGIYGAVGRVERDAYLARAYPNIEALLHGQRILEGSMFTQLAERLLRPLLDHATWSAS
ncbi:DNA helicase/exodeoxyribonuclease V, gamma subunit [Ectothiorhodosinus mongolicus]|uniref:RecBCD enzyme subunit RecC n=2 Tax=Ectothiorhodosinus mongolicus TaxID=233100 RepID=A0A1R3VME6_9GAMM|nr:exodeoxyribonuclease V subunit gamma [Ectothiorhodosinus mongolicus]ULX56245.1 exodeoxyribonuclease V subunit gamma [Ectothiorhodosinus mongolicus]SIT65749.1 DNA helicase/exodeoxyribonuclease V, gamma subunit [Ectothiorhodosinus mongolicus]